MIKTLLTRMFTSMTLGLSSAVVEYLRDRGLVDDAAVVNLGSVAHLIARRGETTVLFDLEKLAGAAAEGGDMLSHYMQRRFRGRRPRSLRRPGILDPLCVGAIPPGVADVAAGFVEGLAAFAPGSPCGCAPSVDVAGAGHRRFSLDEAVNRNHPSAPPPLPVGGDGASIDAFVASVAEFITGAPLAGPSARELASMRDRVDAHAAAVDADLSLSTSASQESV